LNHDLGLITLITLAKVSFDIKNYRNFQIFYAKEDNRLREESLSEKKEMGNKRLLIE